MPWQTLGKTAMTWKVAPRPPKPVGSGGRDWKSPMLAGAAVSLMHSARSMRRIQEKN